MTAHFLVWYMHFNNTSLSRFMGPNLPFSGLLKDPKSNYNMAVVTINISTVGKHIYNANEVRL